MTETIRLTADLAELRRKVNFVRNGLGAAKNDLQQQLIRLELTGNKLTLFAASKELLCRCELKVTRDGDKDGSFSVLGAKLAALVTTAEAERIALEADPENLKATTGFLTVNLTLYDGASLRTIEAGCREHLQTEGRAISREALEEALLCGKSCTTTNSIRPDVNHVELRRGRMLASDGRKIMIYANDTFDEAIELKVPAGSLNSVISALKNIEAERVQLHEGPAYYFTKANLTEYALGVRKTERTFPEVETMLSRATEGTTDEVAVDKHVLTGALSGVALGLESEEVKVDFYLEGTGTNAMLEISALNGLGRRSFERTQCGRTAAADVPLTFPVSYKHMLDTLSVFKGDSVVDMGVNPHLSLLIVRDSNDVREVLTLVPFRTDAQVNQEKAEAAAEDEARKTRVEADDVQDGEQELAEAVEEEDVELV